MGAFYGGPFEDVVDTYAHEGYPAQVMADGSESPHVLEYGRFDHYRPSCGCGWTGATVFPPTQAGETKAMDRWLHEHVFVMVDAAAAGKVVPATALVMLMRRKFMRMIERGRDVLNGSDHTCYGLGVADAHQALYELVNTHATPATTTTGGDAAGDTAGDAGVEVTP